MAPERARPVWGKFIWTMFDSPSSYRAGNGNERGINNKGMVTHDHATRKDAYYFYKANWSAAHLGLPDSARAANTTRDESVNA